MSKQEKKILSKLHGIPENILKQKNQGKKFLE